MITKTEKKIDIGLDHNTRRQLARLQMFSINPKKVQVRKNFREELKIEIEKRIDKLEKKIKLLQEELTNLMFWLSNNK